MDCLTFKTNVGEFDCCKVCHGRTDTDAQITETPWGVLKLCCRAQEAYIKWMNTSEPNAEQAALCINPSTD